MWAPQACGGSVAVVIRRMISRRQTLATLGLTLAFAGLMALSSRLDIPMHPVPMTMQSWAVLLAGAVLGARWGVAAVLVYLAAAAAIGLPVLSDGAGGLSPFVGPTAGYLVAFPIAAGLTGAAASRGLLDRPIAGLAVLFVAHLVLLGLGAAWLARSMGPEAALAVGFTPFLIGAGVKSALVLATRWGLMKLWPPFRFRS